MGAMTTEQVADLGRAKAMIPEERTNRTRYPDELKDLVYELSQSMYLKDIANELGISRTRVSKWVNARRDIPEESVEFIKIRDAAKLLNIGEGVIYELAREGELPGARKIGSLIRIHKPTLMAWFTGEGSSC